MNTIHILPPEQARRIAAGEVIERPAHVVKELLENALDAGATKIEVHATAAGKKMLLIRDNGCGMNPDDARLCIQPHATSKIRSLDDLNTIASFGFRGEALASVTAIARVTLTTRTAQQTTGIRLHFENSECISEESVSSPVGTTLEINDLFFNTPARKKFLKRDETEWNQIMSLVHAYSLNNCDVTFVVHHNDKLVLQAPRVPHVKDRIAQLWDHNTAANMLEITEQFAGDVALSGITSNHHYWRYNRGQMFFFVNGRAVKMPELCKAVMKGYRNVLPPARFPACMLFITVKPESVDVNVHPKKEEVRFVKPQQITTLIHTAITRALENNVTAQLTNTSTDTLPAGSHQIRSNPSDIKSTVTSDSGQREQSPWPKPVRQSPGDDVNPNTHVILDSDPGSHSAQQKPVPHITSYNFDTLPFAPTILQRKQSPFSQALSSLPTTPPSDIKKTSPEEHRKPEQQRVAPHTMPTPTIIGQVLKTYIIIEKDNALIMIDQHAAHERILYEKWMTTFTKKQGTLLLFPLTLTMTADAVAQVCKYETFFADQGITIRQSGEREISVLSTPAGVGNTSIQDLLQNAAAFIAEHESLETELFRKKLNEHVHSHLACKAAIKAGDVLTIEQMKQLVTDLLATNNRFICIHGRPTMWTLSQEQIEKKFRRRGP